MNRIRVVGLSLLLTGGLSLAGCGGGDDVELVEGVREKVDALDNSFAPEEITIPAGAEIEFVNKGRNDHNVIPADEDQDFLTVDTEDLAPGDRAVRRFTETGTFDYYCSIHGTATAGMIGSVTVEG